MLNPPYSAADILLHPALLQVYETGQVNVLWQRNDTFQVELESIFQDCARFRVSVFSIGPNTMENLKSELGIAADSYPIADPRTIQLTVKFSSSHIHLLDVVAIDTAHFVGFKGKILESS